MQLSDLHAGPQVSNDYLRATFARVTALSPAIVAYTGDFTSYHTGILAQAAQVYETAPRGTLGTVGVLGNHDYGPGWADKTVAAQLTGILRERGIHVLRNEVALVGDLQIVGLDDWWAGELALARTLTRHDPRAPSLALSHNPDTVDLAGWGSYQGWVLSGHTHGGQCKPPFLPPPLLPVRNRRYTSGAFALGGGRQLYVNRGVGHLTKVRFNVRPEVTVFTLRSA